MRLNNQLGEPKARYRTHKTGRYWVPATLIGMSVVAGLLVGRARPVAADQTSSLSTAQTSSLTGLPQLNQPAKDTTTAETAASAPANQDALTKGNVAGLWSEGYKGQKMVVAVIDTGIQPHQDLRLSDPNDAKISQADATALIAKKGYGKYINAKIPFGYDYVNNDNDTSAPDDQSTFHGEHVSGIIAGNGDPVADAANTANKGEYITGIAPEAQLLALRVFGGFADESPDNIAKAIHDAVDLGANVINMSLGIGVSDQSLTDEEQAAVKYATDHGVFVAISASNNGNAASTWTSPSQYSPGGINTSYNPDNDGTIADPGAAASAATVAAENTALGNQSDMASFSSWGPLPDYTLKPDVSAPGVDINSTWKDNTYQSDSGTSMASPYIAGSAAIIMQKLMHDDPSLKGSDLVNAVKTALMNSAEPMADINYPGELISPRRQGAGQVDVTKAGNLTSYAQDPTTGIGSVSLKQIGESTNFSVKVTNHSKTDETYTVDNSQGPYTQTQDTENQNRVHDVKLAGASLTADTPSFTVAAGQSKTVNFTLKVDPKTAKNTLAEGYIKFKNADSNQDLSVPYLGFIGDLTQENAIDKSANQKDSVFGGGYLVDENNNPLGITDSQSLANTINLGKTDLTWSNAATKIDESKVAFSPNGDHNADSVSPYVFAKQNLKNVTAEVLDSTGKIVRVVNQETNTDKSYYQDGSDYNNDLTLSPSMRLDPTKFKWDGTVYDQSTGNNKVVPDGQYTYRIVTTNVNSGSNQQQNFDLPVKVDDTAPTIDSATYNGGTLTVSYHDSGVGFSADSDLVLGINGAESGVSLSNDGKNNTGTLTYKLTDSQKNALEQGNGQLKLTLTDVAGNQTTKTIQAAKGQNQANPTSDTVAPQFKWVLVGDKSNSSNGEFRDDISSDMPYWQAITSSDKVAVTAQVPKNQLDQTVFAVDNASGVTYKAKVDQITGLATFDIPFNGNPYVELDGYTTAPSNKFGEAIKSPDAGMIIFNASGYPAFSELTQIKDNPLDDNATATKNVTKLSGAPELPGHKLGDLTTRFDPTPGITFNGLNDNNITLIGATSKLYDANTQLLTISGKVDDPSAKLQILKSPNQDDPQNTVKIKSDGSFSYQVPFRKTEQRGVGYILTTKDQDGKETSTRGTLEIVVDSEFPTLDMPQANSMTVDPQTGDYEITTTSDQFTVKGSADDNVDGYRLYSNSNNVYHEQNNAGFNNHDDPTRDANPYPAHDFNETYDLALGDNYFTITAVDQAGNTVTKKFHVIRQKVPENGLPTGEITGTSTQSTSSTAASTTQPSSTTASSTTAPTTAKQSSNSSSKYYTSFHQTWVVTMKKGVYEYSQARFAAGKRGLHLPKNAVFVAKKLVQSGKAYRVQLTNGKYVTVLKAAVKPVQLPKGYYVSTPKQVEVTAKKGIYEYSTAKFAVGKQLNHVKQHHYLDVKYVVKSGAATRFVLTNGHFVTANKHWVQVK